MASPVKTNKAIGAMLKAESAYLGGGSLSTSTDGQQLAYDSPNGSPFTITDDFDGVIGMNLGGPMPLKMIAPSARVFNAPLPFHFKGAGQAYSSGQKPRSVHLPILANGWDTTLDATGGAEKYTYTRTPGPTGFTSLFGSLITTGEAFPFTGAFAKGWKCTMSGAKPPVHTFDLIGLLGDPTDSSVAETIAYSTIAPPKFESAVVTIGSFLLPDVVSVDWDAGTPDPSARLLGTASGTHAGWWPGTQVTPSLTITIEKTALVGSPYHTSAGLDPYNLRKAVTSLGVSVRLGTVQYNRLTWTFTQAQIGAPIVSGVNGSVATWQIKFTPYSSTPTANDAMNIVAD